MAGGGIRGTFRYSGYPAGKRAAVGVQRREPAPFTSIATEDPSRSDAPVMRAIQVIDTAHLVTLPDGGAVMVGAPPEALKILVLWEFPYPSTVVLPPDPLFAHGMNQASFEFILFNHLFRMNGLRDRKPLLLVCDEEQQPRVESLLHGILRGPDDAAMAAFRTPAAHRRQLLLETAAVSGVVARTPLEDLARVVVFKDGRAELPDGVVLENGNGEVRVCQGRESVSVPRRASSRELLPLYFADVNTPLQGPRFGLQIIGSASGFSGAEWGSCFIVWINGQPLIIDGTPYLDDHLRLLGIEDDHILGYLITHNHEDHANALGQLINRRPVTLLTSGPVMAALVQRLSAILACPAEEVRRLFRWVPLHPGMEGYGEPLHWFGAEIRTWYSVHTIPTLGVDISMGGKHIRMPGDTLWGRQLEPLLQEGVISPERYRFIQHTYDGADVIVADAGGGPIHPDPQEVHELVAHGCCSHLMVTHVPEFAREFLPNAEPGASVVLLPREERAPEEAMALFSSPVLRGVPERWLLALLYGGDMEEAASVAQEHGDGAVMVLAGSILLRDGDEARVPLQRGDLYHPSLTPWIREPRVQATAKWTRVLRIPEPLYQGFLKDTGVRASLERLFRTRIWWRPITGEELGLDTMVELAALCRERRFHAGAEIVRQGDRATHFYIVTEGRVTVERQNGRRRELGSFGPGFSFGEIALLGSERRTATVLAAEETRVLELPGRAFWRHLMGIPLARYHLCRLAAERKAELQQATSEILPAPAAHED
jgi:hypothetical protein